MGESTEPLTLTVKEAAALIPMGINQTYAAVKSGEIPSLRVGQNIRIPRQRFLDWINGEGRDSK